MFSLGDADLRFEAVKYLLGFGVGFISSWVLLVEPGRSLPLTNPGTGTPMIMLAVPRDFLPPPGPPRPRDFFCFFPFPFESDRSRLTLALRFLRLGCTPDLRFSDLASSSWSSS